MDKEEDYNDFQTKLVDLINHYHSKISGQVMSEQLITSGAVVVFKSCPSHQDGIEFIVKLMADLMEIHKEKMQKSDSS